MMTRFDTMTELLNKRKFFKLVCGAGNEDADEVFKLVFIYTLAGVKGFDVSANVAVVRSAIMAIEQATEYAKNIKKEIHIRPFINVSIGMIGDPHARKAMITLKCTSCKSCISECRARAITENLKVLEEKCLGCGDCESACLYGAIQFYHKEKNLKELLMKCKLLGVEQLELHAAVPDSESIFQEWAMINEVIPDNYVSMCLDRMHLSDSHLRKRIKRAKEISGKRLIIQADGVPMSGGKDDYNTTLQAISIADIVIKSKIDTKILLSGGTNSLTAKLADLCGVAFNGVSIGTFARAIVSDCINDESFLRNENKVKIAIEIAEKLVRDNIGEIIW